MYGYYLGIEEVNGTIIGGEYFVGQLFYDGKPQGQKIRGNNEKELIQKAKEKVKKFKYNVIQFGLPLSLSCYADDSKWELRMYD